MEAPSEDPAVNTVTSLQDTEPSSAPVSPEVLVNTEDLALARRLLVLVLEQGS